MIWKSTTPEKFAEVLRFAVRGALLISGIACSVTFAYLVVRACIYFARLMNRLLFSAPW
jgi:hypothetical protein